jgi:hypothetical protein
MAFHGTYMHQKYVLFLLVARDELHFMWPLYAFVCQFRADVTGKMVHASPSCIMAVVAFVCFSFFF